MAIMDAVTATGMLGLVYGLVVGVSLGLTGGGGSIFAVPLLIYGLGIETRAAISLSLAAVGVTAGFGAVLRLKAREMELFPGFVFAVGGMLLAPAGTWLGGLIPPVALLSVFAMLMILVAWRMWTGKPETQRDPGPCVFNNRSRGDGKSPLAAGCYVRLIGAGAAAGVLSGLFGIGGGFIIVPALLHVTGTSIHRAVSTSLMVIFLISLAGVGAHLLQGQQFPMPVSALFVAGGFGGMLMGSGLRSRLSAAALRKVFATGMCVVGAAMLVKNLVMTHP
ncbi:MAG TPA: sulfite exporter TauE/SafE family protein [Candidatus Saccharimonadia bacterium]|nr:sulfite exporter TauE/SafE family protein [Candidatus Saccharimonadia bacterium]